MLWQKVSNKPCLVLVGLWSVSQVARYHPVQILMMTLIVLLLALFVTFGLQVKWHVSYNVN